MKNGEKIMRHIREYAYAFWNGCAFAALSGLGMDHWEWWLFIIVAALLVNIRPDNRRES